MKKQIISCAAVLAMLGTAVCVPESSISCLTTLSLHTAAEETDTPDDAATESQVYDTSTLTLGTKLSQGDTLHYDKQNVGSVANIVNAKGDYDLAFISEEDYVLPFDAEVVGITALTIYLAPAVDGIAYTDVRTLSDGDTIDRNTNLLCYDYVINNRVLPVFLPSYYDKYIGTGTTTELDEGQLIKMMVGREITDVYPKLEADIGEVVFEAKNIVRADNKVKGVSLSVRRGEILGIGGLVGAGRSELVEGIFGMHALSQGEIFVHGKRVKISSPEDIIKQGVALITEDRKVTGLNLSGTVNDNIAMVAIKKLLTHGLYNKGKARRASEEYIEKLNIKTPSADQIVGNLSGGNQQKIVIAKWLLNDPDIIILDEPTRGIDVGAKRDIYLLLGNLVRQGKAVIMISSEIPELMGICDRIMVMCEGNYSGEVSREEFSQERIMTLASAIKV